MEHMDMKWTSKGSTDLLGRGKNTRQSILIV
jgi:hypothetical protein